MFLCHCLRCSWNIVLESRSASVIFKWKKVHTCIDMAEWIQWNEVISCGCMPHIVLSFLVVFLLLLPFISFFWLHFPFYGRGRIEWQIDHTDIIVGYVVIHHNIFLYAMMAMTISPGKKAYMYRTVVTPFIFWCSVFDFHCYSPYKENTKQWNFEIKHAKKVELIRFQRPFKPSDSCGFQH